MRKLGNTTFPILCLVIFFIAVSFNLQDELKPDSPAKHDIQANSVIQREFSEEEVLLGKKLYSVECSRCHGIEGEGSPEPEHGVPPLPTDLTQEIYPNGTSNSEVYRSIEMGLPRSSMLGFGDKLTADEIWLLVAYLKSLRSKQG